MCVTTVPLWWGLSRKHFTSLDMRNAYIRNHWTCILHIFHFIVFLTFYFTAHVLCQHSFPLDIWYHNGGVMVSVLVWSVVDRGFVPRPAQCSDYGIGICCFSTKHAALRNKSKDCSLGIRIMYRSGAICLHQGCCLSDLTPYKSNSAWNIINQNQSYQPFIYRFDSLKKYICCLWNRQALFYNIILYANFLTIDTMPLVD